MNLAVVASAPLIARVWANTTASSHQTSLSPPRSTASSNSGATTTAPAVRSLNVAAVGLLFPIAPRSNAFTSAGSQGQRGLMSLSELRYATADPTTAATVTVMSTGGEM